MRGSISMRTVFHISLTVALLAIGAAPAHAQPIIGNLDLPQHGQIVGTDPLFQGWTLSCYTAQQPAGVEVWYLGAPEANGYRPMTVATATGIWSFTATGAWEQAS